MRGNAPERLVSGSDDFTMFLWEPTISKQPKARMTGHQKVYYLILLVPDNTLVFVYICITSYMHFLIPAVLVWIDNIFYAYFVISLTVDTHDESPPHGIWSSSETVGTL